MAQSWFSTERGRFFPALAAAVGLACMLFSAAPVHADTYTPWPGEYLRMGSGARALGMGNAYAAVEGDVYSTVFNPAGLAALDGRELALSVHYLPFDRRFTHLAYGARIGPDADFGISWIQAGTGDIVGRDLNGNPTGNLEDKRNAIGLTFSKNIGRLASIGITTKLALWKLGGEDARSFSFDIGAVVRPLEHLTFSFVMHDIKGRYTWNSDRWKSTLSGANGQPIEKEDGFPLYYTIGAAYRMLGDRLLLSATAEQVEDNPLSLDAGASWNATERFILRAGMYHYTAEDGLDWGSYTFGLSLGLTARTSFDYAYMPDGFIGDDIHTISFVMSYGE